MWLPFKKSEDWKFRYVNNHLVTNSLPSECHLFTGFMKYAMDSGYLYLWLEHEARYLVSS